MTKQHPPPPTQFGTNGTIQGKRSPLFRSVAPPSTLCGPAPLRPRPAVSRTGALQMAREKEEQAHNFMLVPSSAEEYFQHVIMRLRHFVLMMKRLIIFANWAKGQGVDKKITTMASAKAEVQVGTGLRGPLRIDAAHLMNVSIRSTQMSSGLVLTPQQAQAVEELKHLSGATTPQLQSNNVGPDKVIDRCMTEFRNDIDLKWVGAAVPSAQVMLNDLANKCLNALGTASKAAEPHYQTAIAAAQQAKTQTTWEIDVDCQIWKEQYAF